MNGYLFFKNDMQEIETFEEGLFKKIKVLNETTWEFRLKRPKINRWLENFADEKEKQHALFLLSQFMYFGSLQIRELLKSLYRDLYKYPVIESIRFANHNTTDLTILRDKFLKVELSTRFLGIGNPSESGTHLLYFFRQENRMSKNLFINTHEIFKKDSSGKLSLADSTIKSYVFIDDFCGSGSQAIEYSENIVEEIKKLEPTINVSYLMLFATSYGKEQVKKHTKFDYIETVVELDDSFRCFHSTSRYFQDAPPEIDKNYIQKVCEDYGQTLMTNICEQLGFTIHTNPTLLDIIGNSKLGWADSQLLIGFHHNTPDNTLPIIWYDEEIVNWYPVFRRYNKKYGS